VSSHITFGWNGVGKIGRWAFVCGYCGAKVGGNEGYFAAIKDSGTRQGRLYICPNCTHPTLAVGAVAPGTDIDVNIQVPSPTFGEPVDSLPPDAESIY
jgi:hypothetical protein